MISVVIPTLDAEVTLAQTLRGLVSASVDGLVRQVIVSDGGSRDRTLDIADDAGADIVKGPAGRGEQLRAGAAKARFPWLLFLHADTILDPAWTEDSLAFVERASREGRPRRAAAFRFAVDQKGFAPRLLEGAVAVRNRLMKLPYGDQGLLISRSFYDELGGYSNRRIMEDVDLVRRIGGRRIEILSARAVTSAARYRKRGYVSRVARNQLCLALYFAGASDSKVEAIYRGRSAPAKSTLDPAPSGRRT